MNRQTIKIRLETLAIRVRGLAVTALWLAGLAVALAGAVDLALKAGVSHGMTLVPATAPLFPGLAGADNVAIVTAGIVGMWLTTKL